MNLLLLGALFALLFAGFPSHMRKKLFSNADASCELCKRKWYNGWVLEMHHKIPLSLGGLNTLDNGICLCRQCHKKAHIKLFNEAKKTDNKKAMNVNARAVRLIDSIIKQKGHKRYGFE